MNKRTLFLLFLALIWATVSHAQLQVTTASTALNWTAEDFVRNVLLGEGVEVENVRFNGQSGVITCASLGKFTTGANPTNLGMTSGIVFGSSGVGNIGGPSSGSPSSTGCATYPDASLAAIASGSINDCAVLEFDFRPQSDSIKFNYVFASEEYPEYVCSNFNDVFGFFLSGLNPDGGNYENQNIALIPGTTNRVTINSVNPGVVGSFGSASEPTCVLSNSQYYVNNGSGTSIVYDGFTTVLQARARVIPCMTYHIKMCIADVSDGLLDSGVFLEANSFSANPITATYDNIPNPLEPDHLYEGCCAEIVLHRPIPEVENRVMNVTVAGTATNGSDYTYMNNSFPFDANTTSMTLQICPFMDGITEGVESVEFYIQAYPTCPADTVVFYLIDTHPLEVNVADDYELTSAMAEVTLNAEIDGGMPNRRVAWRSLSGGVPIFYGETATMPTEPNRLVVLEVEDSCHNAAYDTVWIGRYHDFSILPHDTTICAGRPLSFDVQASFPAGSDGVIDSCVWFNTNNLAAPEMAGTHQDLTLNQTTTYIVKSYYHSHGYLWEDVKTMTITVIPNPEMHVSADKLEICAGDPVTISATGAETYSWNGTEENFGQATSHTYHLDETTTIYVYGSMLGAECHGMDSIRITVYPVPQIAILGDVGACAGAEVNMHLDTVNVENIMWNASPYDVTLAPQTGQYAVQVYPEVSTTYSVVARTGVCSASATHYVDVAPLPVAKGKANPQSVRMGEMESTFIDLSENSTSREWRFPDGMVSTQQQAVYAVPDDDDTVYVELWAFNAYGCSDSTLVPVYVDRSAIWIPNVFTPDNSTNQTFLVQMNDVTDYHIRIYNRAGNLVFESRDPEHPWDGTLQNGQKCPQGAYVYRINCTPLKRPGDIEQYTGTVLLLR